MLVQRFMVTNRPGEAAGQVSESWGISVADVLSSPYILIGSIDEIVDMIEQRRDQLGLTYYVIFDPDIDNFAPIVARLKGE